MTHAEERQLVLIAELQHRTRNLLGVVQSIARQTLPDDMLRDALMARLTALGRVQGLISTAIDEWVDLGDLVRLELGASRPRQDRVSVSGLRFPSTWSRCRRLPWRCTSSRRMR
jgi:two-component system CheB/CheR fusion protein